MKVVLLTAHCRNGEPQHRYVAHEVAKAFPEELAAIIVATGLRKSPWQRVRRLLARYSLAELISRTVIRLEHKLSGRTAARDATFNRIFFPHGGGEHMPRPDLLIETPAHNSAACHKLLDEIQPDIVLTYGTLILRPALIGKAAISTINMHTGVSPTYRGSDTIFWPLYFEEPQFIGTTIHRVDPGIDTGAILHIARPAITQDDDIDSLFAKSVRAGTPWLIKAAREEFEGTSTPVIQDLAKGREFRSVDRTVKAERRVRSLLRGGLLREYGKTRVEGDVSK